MITVHALQHYSGSNTQVLCSCGLACSYYFTADISYFVLRPHNTLFVCVSVFSSDTTFFFFFFLLSFIQTNKAPSLTAYEFVLLGKYVYSSSLLAVNCLIGHFSLAYYMLMLLWNSSFDITDHTGQRNSVCSPWHQNSKPSSHYLIHSPRAEPS